MEIFYYIWAIVGATITVIGLFYAGYEDSYNRENIALGSLFIGPLWPALLLLVAIMAPFYGIFKLGEYYRARQNDPKNKR